jgi:hypothetical protein
LCVNHCTIRPGRVDARADWIRDGIAGRLPLSARDVERLIPPPGTT